MSAKIRYAHNGMKINFFNTILYFIYLYLNKNMRLFFYIVGFIGGNFCCCCFYCCCLFVL